MASVIALLLVAVSLGLSNFAAAIGIGFAGVDAGARLRVGSVFGIFEAGMPIAGLVLGRSLAAPLGHGAHWAGGGLLIATGGYTLILAARGGADPPGRVPVAAPAPPDRSAGPAPGPAPPDGPRPIPPRLTGPRAVPGGTGSGPAA